MIKYFIIAVATLGFSFTAQSNWQDAFSDIHLGLGNLSEYTGKVQTDNSGGTNSFEFNPFLSAGAQINIYKQWSFFPEIGLVLPESGRDENITKFRYFINGLIGYSFMDWHFKTGPGLFMTNVSSEGGTQVLRNGDTIEEFPMPNGNSTSRNLTYLLGAEYFWHQDWSAKAETYFFNLLSSENRAISYTLGIHYHFGELNEN